jgi:hypothetical protein
MNKCKYRSFFVKFIAGLLTVFIPALAYAGQDDLNQFLHIWMPLIVMAIAFYFIRRKMGQGSYGNYMKRQNEHMDKVEKLLERIASAIEKDRKQ